MSALASPPPVGSTTTVAARMRFEIMVLCAGRAARLLLDDRRALGMVPLPAADIYIIGQRLFARIDFEGSTRSLVIPLDVWLPGKAP